MTVGEETITAFEAWMSGQVQPSVSYPDAVRDKALRPAFMAWVGLYRHGPDWFAGLAEDLAVEEKTVRSWAEGRHLPGINVLRRARNLFQPYDFQARDVA